MPTRDEIAGLAIVGGVLAAGLLVSNKQAQGGFHLDAVSPNPFLIDVNGNPISPTVTLSGKGFTSSDSLYLFISGATLIVPFNQFQNIQISDSQIVLTFHQIPFAPPAGTTNMYVGVMSPTFTLTDLINWTVTVQ